MQMFVLELQKPGDEVDYSNAAWEKALAQGLECPSCSTHLGFTVSHALTVTSPVTSGHLPPDPESPAASVGHLMA